MLVSVCGGGGGVCDHRHLILPASLIPVLPVFFPGRLKQRVAAGPHPAPSSASSHMLCHTACGDSRPRAARQPNKSPFQSGRTDEPSAGSRDRSQRWQISPASADVSTPSTAARVPAPDAEPSPSSMQRQFARPATIASKASLMRPRPVRAHLRGRCCRAAGERTARVRGRAGSWPGACAGRPGRRHQPIYVPLPGPHMTPASRPGPKDRQ